MVARHRATDGVVAGELPPAGESAAQRLCWRVLMSFAVTGLVVALLMATARTDAPEAAAADPGSGVYSDDSAVAQPSTHARLTPSFGVPGTPDGFPFPGLGTTASSVQRAGDGSAPSTGLTGLSDAVSGVVGGATEAVGEVVGGTTDALGGAVGGVVGGVTGGGGGLLGG
ncbi:hypothetical protein SAMN05660657_00157 [Geodermatophilus amargosae]|uniref:Uncharacterized protein n=1 Tax=Geodermatophilus amargosae TaxID=1296565 RepID=A0A1I6X6V5_9ACTN|nr:hypothetical protein [Geodermatophilus amargosae]SFT33604.1 hypothetical protein SAMN05660657_00157 [Geodermatophilus amargosae]